jgi:hypothetical protein
MNAQPAVPFGIRPTEAEDHPWKRRRTILVLLFLGLVIALARLHTCHEPPEPDLATYTVIGKGLLEGRTLYSGLWHQKPPATHVTYALGVWVGGFGPGAIYLLNVFAAGAIMLGVFFAGKALDGRAETGLWAAGFWVLISGDLYLQGNQPNTEVFMNACQVWALALWVRPRGGLLRMRDVLLIGALFALSSLYKQIAWVMLATLGAAYVLIQGGWRARRQAFVHLCVMGLVCAAAWAAVFGYFGFRGRLHNFYSAVFTYNRFYAGSMRENVLQGFSFSSLAPACLRAAVWPLGLLGVSGLYMALKQARGSVVLLLAAGLGAALEVSLPGKFWPHYYQFWLPLFCVGGAWGIAGLRSVAGRWAKPIACAGGLLAVLALLAHEAPFYRLSPDEWSRRKYGDEYVIVARLGHAIGRTLRPEENFFVWGAQSGLYYNSGRLPPTCVLYPDPLLGGPLAKQLSEQVIHELQRAPPEILITEAWRRSETPHPVLNWFQARYRRLPLNAEWSNFPICIRIGGRLDREISALSANAGTLLSGMTPDQLADVVVMDGPLGEKGYALDLSAEKVPTQWQKNELKQCAIRMKNNGNVGLSSLSSDLGDISKFAVRMSYRWTKEGPVQSFAGFDTRTELPGAIKPNAVITMNMAIQAPSTPGTYWLEIEAVQEFAAWFKDKGSPGIRMEAEVK